MMKVMKRFLVFAMIASLFSFGLLGCGNGGANGDAPVAEDAG